MADRSISTEAAGILNSRMPEISGLLNDAIRVADASCNEVYAKDFQLQIAQAMTIIGWDVLEGMIYSHHPDLRPYSLSIPPEAR